MAAEVATAGRFIYVSICGNDSTTVFRADPRPGMPEKIQVEPSGGKAPQTFAIDPSGKYLVIANQDSGRLTIFAIDRKAGTLAPTGQVLDRPSPISIQFIPAK